MLLLSRHLSYWEGIYLILWWRLKKRKQKPLPYYCFGVFLGTKTRRWHQLAKGSVVNDITFHYRPDDGQFKFHWECETRREQKKTMPILKSRSIENFIMVGSQDSSSLHGAK